MDMDQATVFTVVCPFTIQCPWGLHIEYIHHLPKRVHYKFLLNYCIQLTIHNIQVMCSSIISGYFFWWNTNSKASCFFQNKHDGEKNGITIIKTNKQNSFPFGKMENGKHWSTGIMKPLCTRIARTPCHASGGFQCSMQQISLSGSLSSAPWEEVLSLSFFFCFPWPQTLFIAHYPP